MHALLVTLGTDGDVYPYAAIGARLKARGHRVTLLSAPSYADFARERGLEFAPLTTAADEERLLGNPDFWHPLKGVLVAARWGAGLIEPQYRILAEHAGPDAVLLANPGVLAARLLHDRTGRPLVSLVLQPGLIPSSTAPPVVPGLSLPAWAPWPIGRLYWAAVDTVGDLLVGRHVNRLRSKLGLRPVRRIFQWWLSPRRVVGLFPDWYGPPQPDWPRQVRLAGFPPEDGRPGRGLPADLREFCTSGVPVVAFTMGTGVRHAAGFYRTAAAACRALGVRGVLLTRHTEQLPRSLPPSVRHCEYAPFGELFPLCAAVVHHGGIGTTARCLAAGVPQLVLPLAFDQSDNAARVRALGVGSRLAPHDRTGSLIARALAGLFEPAVRERCRQVACRFGGPDAHAAVADEVEAAAKL